jgi:L-gulonate 3-dehydrogenase
MLFASSGFHVVLYDVINENVDKALADISQQLNNLESKGLLRGDINAKQQFALIEKVDTLQQCLNGAIHVQVYSFNYFLTTNNKFNKKHKNIFDGK